MEAVLDVLSSLFGLVGSILVLVSAWRAAPFRRTTDLAGKIKADDLLADEAREDAEAANRQLADVMSLEPRLIVAGGISLGLGFLCALAKHAF